MSRRASRHAGRLSSTSHSSEPIIRIPAFIGTGSYVFSVSSHTDQLRYKRRNILNDHESFPRDIILTHRAVAIPELISELLSQRYVALQDAGQGTAPVKE